MFEFLQDPFLLSFFVAGVALLVLGRRLVWLLATVVGFFVAFSFLQTWSPDLGLELRLASSAGFGLILAALVLFVQRIGVGVVSAGAGGFVVFWLLTNAGYQLAGVAWVAVAGGAGVGFVLGRGLFRFGLAVLTSIVGAALVLEAVGGGTAYQPAVLLGLAAAGVVIQLLVGRKSE